MTDRKFLFVAGCQRSGTTILGRLLTHHPDISLGVERYKFLFGRLEAKDLGPDLFSEERFFDFRDGDTNIKSPHDYERLKRKFREAKVVGDKIPRLYRYYQKVFDAFPDCRMLYLVRNVESVAASWQTRALDDKDRWPSTNDYKVAVETWNLANRQTVKWVKKKPESLIIVEYEKLFSGNESYLMELLGLIEVPVNKGHIKAFRALTKDWGIRANRPSKFNGEQRLYINQNADLELYHSLIRESRLQQRNSEFWLGA